MRPSPPAEPLAFDPPKALPPAPDTGSGISLRKVGWSLALSLVVIAIIGIVTDFDGRAAVQAMSQMHYGLMALAVLMLGLRVLFGAWRLQYVAQGRLSFMASLRGQLSWDFFSNVTPSAIGGGPFAAVYVARDADIPVGESYAILLFSMLLDQFWTALSVLVIIAVALVAPVFPDSIGRVGMWTLMAYFAGMLGWTVLFAYTMLRRPDWLETAAQWVCRHKWLRRFEEKVTTEMRQLRRRATLLRSRGVGFYLNGFLLTTASWLARYAMLVFIVWSVFPGLEKLLFFVRSMAMTLGSLIMPTPGSAGGIEGFYAAFLGPMMPETLVVPTLVVWRVMGYYLFVLLGLYLSAHSVRQARQRQAARRAEEAAPVAPPPRPPALADVHAPVEEQA